MKIEVAPRKSTLGEIKQGEVFEYKVDGNTYYCIKIENPFTEYDAVSLEDGSLMQLTISERVTPVKARLVVEE